MPIYVAHGATIDINDLRYTLNDDGTATLTSCLSTDKSSITIPSSVSDGSRSYTVTRIGDYAFDQHREITSVSFPNTLEYMSFCSFRWCSGLTSVTIPASLKEFSSSNFSECINLESVTIANGSKLTKVGEAAFYNCNKLPSISLPSTVKELGTNAFYRCSSLTSFTIPSSVETIRHDAFYGCSSLTSIVVPSTVTTLENSVFYGCSSLTTATIPNGLTGIPSYLFYNCEKLASVNIPSGITNIGDWAFYRCKALTAISLPSNLTEIGTGAFQGCESFSSISIPSKVTTVKSSAFRDCTDLTSVTIPSTATTLGDYVFSNCSNLTSATIQNGRTSLPSDLFSFCANLQTVSIPSSVTVIGQRVFYQCSSLNGITLPSNLTEIGADAFSYTPIQTINIPSKVTLIGDRAFQYCKQLQSIVLPNGITEIKGSTFRDCSALQSVGLPTQLTTIGNYAFYGCSSLSSINFPSSLTTIGNYAFQNCRGLEGEISLPQSVTSIKSQAFKDCDKLTSFVCPSNLTELGDYTFDNCDMLQNVVFPRNMTTIPYSVCGTCLNLQTITFPDNVETISGYAFYNSGLSGTLTIPSTVKSIGDYAFYHTNISNVVLPEGLQEIKGRAFQSCESLQKVVLPSSLTKIGDYAFDDCDNLFEITFPTDVSNMTFGNSIYSNNKNLRKVTFPKTGMTTIPNRMFYECDRLRNVELPATLTIIGEYAFAGCDSLQTLYIHDGVTEIQYNAFRNCTKLKYLRLPNTLVTLGNESLGYCESLQFLNIPASVTSVGNYSIHTTATHANTSLKSVAVLGSTMPSTQSHVFWQYQPAFSLLVPAGQESDYQSSASWTPNATDNRTIKGYTSSKQMLTLDMIHLSVLDNETYVQGGPEAVYVDWFEGMGNYRVYYTDSKGNKTTTLPETIGSYTISLEFEEGPYYKAATFNNIGIFQLKDIADEDFALLWDFYNRTYDWSGKTTTWSGNNWKLVEGRKETAVGIFGVKWNNGHVEEINFGRGTSIYNLNANETPLSLFSLPQVKKIEMVNVGLYGDISQKVEEYLASGKTLSPTLEHLDLYNNNLEGNISTLANALPGLKYLDASYNKFSTLYPALPATLETINISNQNITDIVATVDLRDMTEEGFFSTLPSIVFYDPATRTYADNIKINVQSQTNGATFDINYQGSNDFSVGGYTIWKGASGNIAKCSYRDANNRTTNFNAYFFYDMGDVDFNGEVDVLDLQQSVNYAMKDGYSGYSRYNFTAGDLNTDDAINVLDIVHHVDLLLAADKPTTMDSKSRITDDYDLAPCQANLFVRNGSLVMESTSDVAALDIILTAADADRISVNISHGMNYSKKQLSDGRLHLIIYNTSGKTIPAGSSVIATNLESCSVEYAKLADKNANEISVRLNMPGAPIVTGIEALQDEETEYGDDITWEIHAPDGMLITSGTGNPDPESIKPGIAIIVFKNRNGTVVKTQKIMAR